MKVIPAVADRALKNANNDRQKAYGQYIKLYFGATGKLAPGFGNRELQEYYDMRAEKK